MAEYKLGEIETIFADIIWDNEPVTSRRLTELAEERLNWKRTTTYTILKRLCDRELFRNKDGKVTSLVSREEFYARQSEIFVDETFHGSLPAFLAAFGSRKSCLTAKSTNCKRSLIPCGRIPMRNLFSQVLNMSMTGSIVILLVMLARLMLKRSPKIFFLCTLVGGFVPASVPGGIYSTRFRSECVGTGNSGDIRRSQRGLFSSCRSQSESRFHFRSG